MKHSTVLGTFGITFICIIFELCVLFYMFSHLVELEDKYGATAAWCIYVIVMIVVIGIFLFIIYKFVNHNENISSASR
jgi:heme/copper-type cytochrome/quinol oxidase subunit 4